MTAPIRLPLALLLFLATPALAQSVGYDNPAWGFAVDVPDDFVREAESGDRIILVRGTSRLEIFGIDLAPLAFEAAAGLALRSSEDEGFAVTGRTITPDAAYWRGVNGARQLAVGVVKLCGAALAGYELRFMEADGPELVPVIERLDVSLRRTAVCDAT